MPDDDGLDLTPEEEELARRIDAERGNVHSLDQSRRRRKLAFKTPWLNECQEEKGRLLTNLFNAVVGLHKDELIAGCFRFDEMSRDAVLVKRLPVVPGSEPGDAPPHPVADDDATRTQHWLQHRGLTRIGKDTIHQAIDYVAREDSFHPVRDWLNQLRWDEKPRVTSWLATYLGATQEPAEYLAEIGQMFLIAMVARVFKPGCKADYMIVLEGEQGVLKSRALRALASEPWFGDSLPDIKDKDAKQYLRGKWLVEVSELAAFTKAESETLKAFITRQTEDYRAAYGRKNTIEPRQCLFAGTTNRASYVKDDTGARRYWGFKVGKIDVEAIERDRDQLFAEALVLYRASAPHWPSSTFEAKWIKPQQEVRIEGDPWENVIDEHVNGITVVNEVSVSKLAKEVLGFQEDARVSGMDGRRIAQILQSLGFSQQRVNKRRFYVRN